MIKHHKQFLTEDIDSLNTAKVRLRIKWESNIIAFNLGYRVNIDKWSKETQRCKTNSTHGKRKIPAATINKKIQLYESITEKIFSDFSNEKQTLLKEDFRNLFNELAGKINQQKEFTFFDAYDQFLAEEGRFNNWTTGTIAKMTTVRNHLYCFKSNFTFSEVTEDGLHQYLMYLQSIANLRNTTIIKHFSLLKWFLNWAFKKKYLIEDFYKNYKPRLKSTQKQIVFLSHEELKKLQDYVISEDKSHLEKIRDVFIFQCYTGLRFSDVQNLRKTDIIDGIIHITTIKTSDSILIELNKYSKSILQKYQDSDSIFALPVISNQKTNVYLQELAQLAGIDTPIRETYYKGNQRIDQHTPKYALLGTHAGRRTFICNALALGIPAHVVMKWTGHKDYKAMKPYIDIADKIKASAMDRFNTL